jgi:hypothetical protein
VLKCMGTTRTSPIYQKAAISGYMLVEILLLKWVLYPLKAGNPSFNTLYISNGSTTGELERIWKEAAVGNQGILLTYACLGLGTSG